MGPLKKLKIIELAGVGPAPMCAMLLADLGASVIRVDRRQPAELGVQRPRKYDLLLRNRPAIHVDLKDEHDRERVLDLIAEADMLIEGFRPGVAERLGLGPDDCLARNPKLIYGRMTGWGQAGPLAQSAGHDLNYIAITGALHALGRKGQAPTVPLNIVGDIGGGALYLAMGMLAALHEAQASGKGQVVDAAIVDGVASLMTQTQGTLGAGMMKHERGTNHTDSGAPFYEVYECADGRYVSFAPVEPKFYRLMLEGLELDPSELPAQWDRERWPEAKDRIAARVRTRTRDEWAAIFSGSDACFAPVLTLDEAILNEHLVARRTYVDLDGVVQPAPAPRFSRSVPDTPRPVYAWDDMSEEDIVSRWLAGS
ncbi:MAG: CaiB/BaiF CoA transferase family protein [Flavobacteriaceae bacterium]